MLHVFYRHYIDELIELMHELYLFEFVFEIILFIFGGGMKIELVAICLIFNLFLNFGVILCDVGGVGIGEFNLGRRLMLVSLGLNSLLNQFCVLIALCYLIAIDIFFFH